MGLADGWYGRGGGGGLGGDVKGSAGFDGPGGVLLDALRVIGQAAVDELEEAIALAGGDVDREVTAGGG